MVRVMSKIDSREKWLRLCVPFGTSELSCWPNFALAGMEKDKPANIPKRDRKSPFLAKSRNGSTPISISQRTTLCALPKTEPAGDAIHSTAIPSTNDDDDEDDDDARTTTILLFLSANSLGTIQC